jgi:hypothetical protein
VVGYAKMEPDLGGCGMPDEIMPTQFHATSGVED